ncbi:MAG TPA: hypothetical protein PLD88_03565, partial [Candidatus Berkiella sp.]|nr:hypothetical protein [Candidatus Berkiella sp.]
MAKRIQSKIAMALNQKKQRASHHFEPLHDTWQTILNSSEVADLIPSLNELQIDTAKQTTTAPQLKELFQTMTHYLKKNYFDNQLNDAELSNYLNLLSQEIEKTTNDKKQQETIEYFFQVNKRKICLIYINSEPELSICFSKLIVNVLSKQIKDNVG